MLNQHAGNWKQVYARKSQAQNADEHAIEVADEPQLYDLIQQIQAGETSVAAMSGEQRLACVRELTMSGFSIREIAQFLGVSTRTVERDRLTIREADAVYPRYTLVHEVVGEFQQITLASIQRLMRMCNDTSLAPHLRVMAEDTISRSYNRWVRTLHELKYTPKDPKRAKLDAYERQMEVMRFSKSIGFDGLKIEDLVDPETT